MSARGGDLLGVYFPKVVPSGAVLDIPPEGCTLGGGIPGMPPHLREDTEPGILPQEGIYNQAYNPYWQTLANENITFPKLHW